MFGLCFKTKNFHRYISGPRFRDCHLLLDAQGDSLMAATDAVAERGRKIGGTALRSVRHIGRLQRTRDNNAGYVGPVDTPAKLDSKQLAAWMTSRVRACLRAGSTRSNAASASYLKQLAPAVNGQIRGEIRLALEASRPLAFLRQRPKEHGPDPSESDAGHPQHHWRNLALGGGSGRGRFQTPGAAAYKGRG
jgi:DNA-binding ferritin-like protein